MSDKVITAVYRTPAEATDAVNRLEACGCSDDQISVLMSDAIGEEFKLESKSKLPEGTALGAVGGGAIGALGAGLTAFGTFSTGGAGLLVAGPMVAALAGAGAGSALGGIAGALVGYGFSEHEAKLFAEEYKDGKILVAVNCDNDEQQDRVEDVFNKTDAKQTAGS